MAQVRCLHCRTMNQGYIRIYDDRGQWNYYYSECRCPIPTMRHHAISAGMHPEHPRKENHHGKPGLE